MRRTMKWTAVMAGAGLSALDCFLLANGRLSPRSQISGPVDPMDVLETKELVQVQAGIVPALPLRPNDIFWARVCWR